MENNIKKVHLVLKHQWYDMIESGVKQEEYRNNTTRYQDMLNNFRIKKNFRTASWNYSPRSHSKGF